MPYISHADVVHVLAEGFDTFSKHINYKVDEIVRQMFELVFFDITFRLNTNIY